MKVTRSPYIALASLALLSLATSPLAQNKRTRGGMAAQQTQTLGAALSTHVLELGGPDDRYVVLNVSGAEGRAFVALGSFGVFDPQKAFMIGFGRVDASGNGTLTQRIPTGALPPNTRLDVAAAYMSGGQLAYTPPVTAIAAAWLTTEMLDFDFSPGEPDPKKGQIMAEEYALLGIHISATNNVAAKVGAAIIWDAKSTSGGDFDLITPDQDKVLIIAENLIDADMDGFVDNPDDERYGGSLIFDCDDPLEIVSLTVIDIDVGETAFARFTHSDASTTVQNFAATGNGVVQTLNVSESDVVKLEVVFSNSGGLVSIGAAPCPYLVNFDERTFGEPLPLQTGEWITNQFADIGLTIAANNAVPGHPNKAILFDSEHPTGGDPDLMTPGYGFNNTVPLGKVLIIAENDVDENMDGLVDVPDDESGGGAMIFSFADNVELHGFTILDIDGSEFDYFEAFDSNHVLIGTQQIPPMGDNSVIQFDVEPPLPGVRRVVLNLGGSGAVTRLRFCPENRAPVIE